MAARAGVARLTSQTSLRAATARNVVEGPFRTWTAARRKDRSSALRHAIDRAEALRDVAARPLTTAAAGVSERRRAGWTGVQNYPALRGVLAHVRLGRIVVRALACVRRTGPERAAPQAVATGRVGSHVATRKGSTRSAAAVFDDPCVSGRSTSRATGAWWHVHCATRDHAEQREARHSNKGCSDCDHDCSLLSSLVRRHPATRVPESQCGQSALGPVPEFLPARERARESGYLRREPFGNWRAGLRVTVLIRSRRAVNAG